MYTATTIEDINILHIKEYKNVICWFLIPLAPQKGKYSLFLSKVEMENHILPFSVFCDFSNLKILYSCK